MKTIHLLFGCRLLRIFTAAGLFTFGLELRLPAPPATPVPTYYGESFDFGTGATLDLTPIASGTEYEIEDWNIPTPDGTLTPSDSEITSGAGPYSVSSFFDIFTDIQLDPIIFQGTSGSYIGDDWTVELGPVGASISDPDGGVSQGSWSIPDHSPTWLLLLAGAGVLCLGRKKGSLRASL